MALVKSIRHKLLKCPRPGEVLTHKPGFTCQHFFQDANFKRIEHVTVTVDIDTEVLGTTTVDLISPAGIISNLSVVRRRDVSSEDSKTGHSCL
ncbi:CMF_collapsed_G0045280.mRNA.1.CDS.1 [Saccharomyces cerevisiae]|nr:CMF_collapsed_G0045280.mRNA.1.CDS.1 [Saccharomyces cerevisiae]